MTLTVNRDSLFRSIAVAVLSGVGLLASAQVEVNALTPDEYVNGVLLGTGVEATNVVSRAARCRSDTSPASTPLNFPLKQA